MKAPRAVLDGLAKGGSRKGFIIKNFLQIDWDYDKSSAELNPASICTYIQCLRGKVIHPQVSNLNLYYIK